MNVPSYKNQIDKIYSIIDNGVDNDIHAEILVMQIMAILKPSMLDQAGGAA